MIEIYNIIEESVLNFFRRSKEEKQFHKIIDKIKTEQLKEHIKEKGLQQKYDHNWEYFYRCRCEDKIHQESLKLMNELNLTFYFEDDAMGAQFYTIYKDKISIGTNNIYRNIDFKFSQEEALLYFLFKYKERLNK